MSANTQIAKPKFSAAIQTDTYKKLINNTLNDKKRSINFIAAISATVAVNPALQKCDAGSILGAALLGESLKLSPSPQMGHYYMVPYDVSVKDADGKVMWENGKRVTEKRAQFQMGYKGYIQLAIRSGYYRRLNVMPIKQGEFIKFDVIDETIELDIIEDEDIRESTETIGYYAMFEYHNGFRKAIYWSKKKMENHANKYSTAFSLDSYKKLLKGEIPDKEKWKYSSFWYSDFDTMAQKTMLRQLISKWGIMSIELQEVFEKDMAVLEKDGGYSYVDNSMNLMKMPEPETESSTSNVNEPGNDSELPFDGIKPKEVSFDDL